MADRLNKVRNVDILQSISSRTMIGQPVKPNWTKYTDKANTKDKINKEITEKE